MKSFENKVVLVSGAGKGIGKQIAESFLEMGAKVAFFDKNQVEVKEDQKILFRQIDLIDFDSLADFVEEVQEKLGPINILINNAGVGLAKKFFKTTSEDFDTVFATNLKGTFFLTQEVSSRMTQGDSVLFVTSIHAKHPSLDPTYDGSKAAINNLVVNLALELAPRGVRVNAVAPGHIDVETQDSPRDQWDVPLGKKAGLPRDVANACLFLADNERSGYITGEILNVTGGLHIPIAKDIEF